MTKVRSHFLRNDLSFTALSLLVKKCSRCLRSESKSFDILRRFSMYSDRHFLYARFVECFLTLSLWIESAQGMVYSTHLIPPTSTIALPSPTPTPPPDVSQVLQRSKDRRERPIVCGYGNAIFSMPCLLRWIILHD